MTSHKLDVSSPDVSIGARDYLFYAGFLGESENTTSKEAIGYSGLDKIQSYRYNSHGYRGPEFSSQLDLLCSGDSQTFGVGLPEDSIWPTMLAKTLGNVSYANLSLPGSSVHSIVADIFTFVSRYGSPKNLFVLFPDFSRFLLWSNNKSFATADRLNHNGPANAQLGGHWGSQPTYSKIPHLAEQVISREHCYLISIQMINLLEIFCDAYNINLKWSVWNTSEDLDLVESIKDERPDSFRYFFSNDARHWGKDHGQGIMTFRNSEVTDGCHKEFEIANPNIFNFATDKYPHHDGMHRHLHVVEEFTSLYKKKD